MPGKDGHRLLQLGGGPAAGEPAGKAEQGPSSRNGILKAAAFPGCRQDAFRPGRAAASVGRVAGDQAERGPGEGFRQVPKVPPNHPDGAFQAVPPDGALRPVRGCFVQLDSVDGQGGFPADEQQGDDPAACAQVYHPFVFLKPGEVAATGGTSGVVYGVLGEVNYDSLSRVNTFAHVNHNQPDTRLGVLLCINGTGILNAWVKRTIAPEGISYSQMNDLAESVPVGAEGLSVIPFGNGAERVLQNVNRGASIHGINFNIHKKAHIIRAAQEGIAFSFAYGMEIMAGMGMDIKTIKAGHANLFLSPLFRRTLAAVTGASIELYETDGSVGAAYGAGIGAGIYKDSDDAFKTLKHIATEEPVEDVAAYKEAYERWKACL